MEKTLSFRFRGSGPSRSSRPQQEQPECPAEQQRWGRSGSEAGDWPLMKTVSHLGLPEFEGIGLRDVTGCGSQADPASRSSLGRQVRKTRAKPAHKPVSPRSMDGEAVRVSIIRPAFTAARLPGAAGSSLVQGEA